MAELIRSAANPVVKRLRLLADRKHRRREQAFVVDGAQPVWQAVEAGAEIEVLILAPELLGRSPAAEMVARQEERGTRVVRVTRELFLRLSDRDGPSGLAAIVRGRTRALDELPSQSDSQFVALHEIANPGNLGTIIRTADSVGGKGVILIGQTADPLAPTAVKATMGAIFNVPVVHTASLDEFFDWAAEREIAVITTSAGGGASFWSAPYALPLAILLGSEGRGLPPEALARGQLQVRIPMTGTAESLNLAVAAGLLMYEVRRRFDGPVDSD